MGHVVWTLEDVIAALPEQDTYWIGNCICREESGSTCTKGLNTCLGFTPGATSTPHGLRAVGRAEVDALVAFARAQKLVPRPYLSDDDGVTVVGSCFCCACCCTYIVGENSDDGNVAGPKKEATDPDLCVSCGACVDVCAFAARSMDTGELTVDASRCFGCGVCVDECPNGAIAMVPRV